VPDPFKLYLDQMFGTEVAETLRSEGYDVLRAFEVGQSRADDSEILQRAIAENRILITLDEHFGDWAILPLSAHSGVIRIKVHPTTSSNVLALLVPFLKNCEPEQLKDHLVILSAKRAKWIHTA
jgi:predicted nuclease of predicted toxin-antitoxin system